jgi:peroxiredoxin
MPDTPPSAVATSRSESIATSRLAPAAAVFVALAVAAMAWLITRQPEAPNLKFTTLSGQRFDTASLKGKVVLVNFWATSCTFCIHEMPGVVRTYNRFHDQGLDVVAVAMKYDPPSYVLDYSTSRHLPFKVALDLNGEAAKQFGNVEDTPTTVVIDRSGRIVARFQGELEFEALNSFLSKELAEPASAS